MRGDMTQQVLQIVYDRFYNDGGVWPTLGYLQRELNRQSGRTIDAVRIVQRIPVHRKRRGHRESHHGRQMVGQNGGAR
jgi:hypothetical protein